MASRAVTRRIVLFALAAAAGCGDEAAQVVSDPNFGASPADCADPAMPAFATVDVGRGSSNGSFAPLADGDSIAIERGGQGLTMVVLRFRATGPTAACATQTTDIVEP